MPTSLDELIYQTTQKMRSAWYSLIMSPRCDQRRASKDRPKVPLPSWRTVYHDLNDLLERDWQNVREGLYPTPLPADTGPIASARKSFAFLGTFRPSIAAARPATGKKFSIRISAGVIRDTFCRTFIIKAAVI